MRMMMMMASPGRCRPATLSAFVLVLIVCSSSSWTLLPKVACAAGIKPTPNFNQDFTINWGTGGEAKILDNGQQMQLSLDRNSGAEFASKSSFLFGSIGMQIKLVPGDSAGTVTSFYMASNDLRTRDELDFEFLGNVSGQPYALQTNVFANGQGGREQRINLWFDPTLDFHTYSVLWNHNQIVFFVDGLPIRVYKNNVRGVAYPSKQPMRVFASIWNGENWATRGGLDKIKWEHAPFTASFKSFQPHSCEWDQLSSSPAPPPCARQTRATSSSPAAGGGDWWDSARYASLNPKQRAFLSWVKRKLTIYDYCADTARYPTPPPECFVNN